MILTFLLALGFPVLFGGTEHPALADAIAKTRFVDVHAHVVVGHVPTEEEDIYPTLEPPLGRPFWVVKKDRIAVFDTMEPRALRAIYGYTRDEVREEDLPELKGLSEAFWKAGNRAGFDKVLDLCGIERVFDNTSKLEDINPARVFWVPFVDHLFCPMDPTGITGISPDLKLDLEDYAKDFAELIAEHGAVIKDLPSWLVLVDKVLDGYKRDGAVALKVVCAYRRSLWFDDVPESEAASLFLRGLKGRLTTWEEYKKVQDFIARHIFLKAGQLGLPVHFHTGFGANAGLKSLDANPLNLESVLSDFRFKDTTFVILHAGYPAWDHLKPLLEKRNVYVEFSAVNWFVYEKELTNILYSLLTYPGASEKILFASDAGAPVFFWIAAENSRRALYGALSRLIDEGIIDEAKAVRIALKIMRDNALRIHGGR